VVVVVVVVVVVLVDEVVELGGSTKGISISPTVCLTPIRNGVLSVLK